MRIGIAIFLCTAMLALSSAQEKPQATDSVTPSIGLAVGQQAPAFSLSDQFGHEQSNETLRSSHGTVILFFRSADW